MKFMIVGLGSMGKRRARLLKGLCPDAVLLGVDSQPQRREEAKALGIAAFENIELAVKEKPEAALVCTAPLSHAGIIRALLERQLPVFTELNLVSDGYGELIKTAKEKNLPLFLSSTMLYREETQYIKKTVKNFASPVNYIYHIGQYLPDWHPWENYKNFFVGDKRTGGCREIFGIDLPWLLDAFGPAEPVCVQKRSVTRLDIGYPDSYMVTLLHQNGTLGMLAVDVASPKAVRSFECYGEGLHLFWEGNPKELYQFDLKSKQKIPVNTYGSVEHDSRYSDNIVENAYVDELANFLGVLQGTQKPRYSFEQDYETLRLIDRIEGERA